jgi:DNA helicase MCM8
MRAAAQSGDAVPVTTRQLESLVRLAQARAKAELRELVTESDARDVIDLMHEAMLDGFTAESGEVDVNFGRSGGMSLSKKVKRQLSCAVVRCRVRGYACSAARLHGLVFWGRSSSSSRR